MGLHVALVFIYFPLAICNLALGRPGTLLVAQDHFTSLHARRSMDLILLTSFQADPTEHSPRPSPIYLSGNATTTTSSLATEEGIGTQSGGCVFFSTGSDGIPVGASGSTTLPPYTSGGPSQTVPCAKIVQYYREKHLNSSKSSSTAPPSLTGDDPLQSRPTFRAPDLTGCYAGTGGSTVRKPLCRRSCLERKLMDVGLYCLRWKLFTGELRSQWRTSSFADWGICILLCSIQRPGFDDELY